MKKLILFFALFSIIGCKQKPAKSQNGTDTNQQTTVKIMPDEPNPSEYKYQIIPGKRLGTIVLNENATSVLDSLGKPESGDAAMGKAVSNWNENTENSLSIYTTTKMGVEDFSRIKAARTLSPKFQTQHSIGVNSTLEEIESNYKLNKVGYFTSKNNHYTLYSTEEGIGFEIGDDKKCCGIVLTEKGSEPQQLYLTFYPELKKAE